MSWLIKFCLRLHPDIYISNWCVSTLPICCLPVYFSVYSILRWRWKSWSSSLAQSPHSSYSSCFKFFLSFLSIFPCNSSSSNQNIFGVPAMTKGINPTAFVNYPTTKAASAAPSSSTSGATSDDSSNDVADSCRATLASTSPSYSSLHYSKQQQQQ